jgi:hypothetical protein
MGPYFILLFVAVVSTCVAKNLRCMGVPTLEVGYTPAMPRREDDEVHKGHVALEEKKEMLLRMTGV